MNETATTSHSLSSACKERSSGIEMAPSGWIAARPQTMNSSAGKNIPSINALVNCPEIAESMLVMVAALIYSVTFAGTRCSVDLNPKQPCGRHSRGGFPDCERRFAGLDRSLVDRNGLKRRYVWIATGSRDRATIPRQSERTPWLWQRLAWRRRRSLFWQPPFQRGRPPAWIPG